MTDAWVASESLNLITWRDFMRLAEPHGVTLETTEKAVGDSGEKGQYLLRTVDGEQLWFPAPSDVDLDYTIGVWQFENICRRLKLDSNFTGWPVIL